MVDVWLLGADRRQAITLAMVEAELSRHRRWVFVIHIHRTIISVGHIWAENRLEIYITYFAGIVLTILRCSILAAADNPIGTLFPRHKILTLKWMTGNNAKYSITSYGFGTTWLSHCGKFWLNDTKINQDNRHYINCLWHRTFPLKHFRAITSSRYLIVLENTLCPSAVINSMIHY